MIVDQIIYLKIPKGRSNRTYEICKKNFISNWLFNIYVFIRKV